ncbi:MAG TPA: putative baseplate assembly protein [Terracidiphilus sp.]|nr:putative baseplate assembly protein [Terracidiphilus sp.]
MTCQCQDSADQLCGCCSGVTQLTPALIVNRPALSSIAYRAGTYPTFLASMQAALSSSTVPALASLRTRSSSDFSLALIDAWAEVLDILTFYTERLANEAFLGTAIETRSVFEIARLVGYKPSPGVSASTVLAFTLATAPGSPATVPIAAGTRVQSVPGPGQTPQVFETSSALTATIANNAIPAATSIPWQLNGSDTSTWIAGTANNIQAGNVLLFVSAPNGIPSMSGPAAVVNVTAVTVDSVGGNTLVAWDQQLPAALTSLSPAVCLYVFRTKAALFGANAPWPGMFKDTLENIPGHPDSASDTADWSWVYKDGSYIINLDNSYPGLSPAAWGANASAAQSEWIVLIGAKCISYFQIENASESNPHLYSLSAKTTQLTINKGFSITWNSAADVNGMLWEFVQETRVTTAYVQSQLLTFANLPITALTQDGYSLQSGMLAPVAGDSLLLSGLQPIAANSPIGVSGKRLRIAPTVALSGSGQASVNGGFTPAGAAAALAASLNQPFLVDAYPPVTDPAISGNVLWSVLTVTGQAGILSVPAASLQLQPSASADPATGEAAVVLSSAVNGATTSLTLTAPLARIYDASTVNVNANAVEATNGETVMEIVGSGDATNAALQFQLKQSPLTYTSASNTSGVQSTLQVRVNNLLWTEVPNLLSSAAGDRVYVTRPNSSGGPSIQFGDGVQGSRTPTGTSNIQAKYRKGIGIAGMVAAGQLTQPLDRPQGLQYVTNPGPATGGADPASAADAQQSAPLPTLTLGRIVSLEDYQNFALAFPGIALALATWTWIGNIRGVFLTLAGEGGTTLNASDQVVLNLLSALNSYGLPNVPVLAVSYTPQNFEVGMQVKVNSPTYDPNLVLSQVWQSLSAAFAFGQLAPGQSVAPSQVLDVAQQVPGVIAVNLTAFNQSGSAAGIAKMLCASGPVAPGASGSGQPKGAQVLLLDPACEGNLGVWL